MADAGYHDAFIVLADENGSVKERKENAGRVKPQMGLTNDESESFWEGANLVASEVKKRTGLRTVFHHHAQAMLKLRLKLMFTKELRSFISRPGTRYGALHVRNRRSCRGFKK